MRRLPQYLVPLFLVPVLLVPRASLACGGCFVPPTQVSSPILQDAERILFVRDDKTKQSIVWVEIKYSGPAKDFGWVLPLPKKPTVGVGTSYIFDQLDRATGPQFRIDWGASENCGNALDGGGGGIGCADAAAGALATNESAPKAADPNGLPPGSTVKVLEHDQVGPYDYQIITGSTADDVKAWLKTNGFDLPGKAVPVLEDHVKKGDVFVAVRLVQGAAASEIKPITLTMPDAEPCVPLRLTAIAAVEDMTVQAYVAGPGRAVPKNHLHVQINPMRVQWFDNASNYGQVLATAIDEAAGRAFVTEYAGPVPAKIPGGFDQFGQQQPDKALIDYTALDVSGVAKLQDACDIVNHLRERQFPLVTETAALLEKATGLALKHDPSRDTPKEVTDWYANSTGCIATLSGPVDGAKLAKDLEEQFAKPLKDIGPLLTATPKFSRLALRISPKEMDRDPVFGFHPTLPDVSNVRVAAANPVCRRGDFQVDAFRLTLKGLGSWVFPGSQSFTGSGVTVSANNAKDARFSQAPAALVVELLDETGDPQPIHKDDVELVDQAIAGATWGKPSLPTGLTLKPATARWTAPQSDAEFHSTRSEGGCTQSPLARRSGSLAVVIGLGLAIVLVRRRWGRTAAG